MDHKKASPLPPLYAGWFNDLLGGEIPFETRATCSDCAMCESKTEPKTRSANYFNPQLKCCTYLPFLPNFLVGMILAEDDPAMACGRASVETRLDAGLAVTPRGLEWPLKMRAQYTQMEPQAFGRTQSVRCPHYLDGQGGLCGIWKYRNSMCSTWFCKYVRGSVGKEFWENAKLLLSSIEIDLASWCAVQLELDEAALDFLLKPFLMPGQLPTLTQLDLDEQVDAERQRRVWANWYGRERDFYRACAGLAASLTWREVLEVCGPDVQLRARLTQGTYRKLISNEIPTRLRVGPFTVIDVDRGSYSLHNPGIGLDSLQVSERVMRLIPYFDGRPTTEIVSQLVEKEGLRFTPELLRRLVDFKILAPEEEA
jgi:hypothetical protein